MFALAQSSWMWTALCEQLSSVWLHHKDPLTTCGYRKLFAGIKQTDGMNWLTTIVLAPGRGLLPLVWKRWWLVEGFININKSIGKFSIFTIYRKEKIFCYLSGWSFSCYLIFQCLNNQHKSKYLCHYIIPCTALSSRKIYKCYKTQGLSSQTFVYTRNHIICLNSYRLCFPFPGAILSHHSHGRK